MNRNNKFLQQIVAILLCLCLGAGTVISSGYASTEENGAQTNSEWGGEINPDSAENPEISPPQNVEEDLQIDEEIQDPSTEEEILPENEAEPTPEDEAEPTPEEEVEPTPEDETESIPEEETEQPTPEVSAAPEDVVPDDAAPDDEETAEPEVPEKVEIQLSVKKSVEITEDEKLELRYEAQVDTAEELEKIRNTGFTVLFPEGQTWNQKLSDPEKQIGYFDVQRDEPEWVTYVGDVLDPVKGNEIWTDAVVWVPQDGKIQPESFVYFVDVPEGVQDVSELKPLQFLSDGEIVNVKNESDWENAELLIQPEDTPESQPEDTPELQPEDITELQPENTPEPTVTPSEVTPFPEEPPVQEDQQPADPDVSLTPAPETEQSPTPELTPTPGQTPDEELTPIPEVEDEDQEAEIVCGKEEHIHSGECYDDDGNLICGLEEHIHDVSCYKKPESDDVNKLSEEPGVDESINKSYVSSLAITQIVDGTEIFDDNDNPGNDSNANNKIVRSFDKIKYTLSYTTALMDGVSSVSEANIMLEVVLNNSPAEARFDDDLFKWMTDKKIVYQYEAGEESETIDINKKIVKQTLTGKMLLTAVSGSDPIPGNGTLSAGVMVEAAPNNSVIEPEFKVWMEGNEANGDEFKGKTVTANETNSVKVSAAPAFNVQLKRNTACDILGYFDMNSGTFSNTKIPDSIHGRAEGFGITVQLYNTNADKGLKGIELPKGNVEFDINLTETFGESSSVPADEKFKPLLWDYRLSQNANPDSTRGILNHEMNLGGSQTAAEPRFVSPGSNYAEKNSDQYCYNSGTFEVTDNGNGTFHVTIKDYLFDLLNFHFPTKDFYSSFDTYGNNIGCFFAGYLQFICQFPDEIMEDIDLYFNAEVNNFHADSVSNQTTTEEQYYEDNKYSSNITLYPSGDFSKTNLFRDKNFGMISSSFGAGDAYAFRGQSIKIRSQALILGDYVATNLNLLQKFDNNAFDVSESISPVFDNEDKHMDIHYTVLYAAKPDGTGWASDSEMDQAKEENLIYYDSISALKAQGKICVGVLYEIRNSTMPEGNYNGDLSVKLKNDTVIGTVYQTVNTARFWNGDEEVISWRSVSYDGTGYGVGITGQTEIYEKFRSPLAVCNNEPPFKKQGYQKSSYEKGGIMGGHTGGYQAGNSILIIGCKTGVSVNPKDNKSTYNLDKGEHTVEYVLHPTVEADSENSEVTGSDDTTNIELTVTLPPGMSYVPGSSEPEPKITVNPDGSTTLTWELNDRKIGDPVPDIHFKCNIDYSVKNGDNLTVKSSISSDKDQRVQKPQFGNYSETTVSVVQLAKSSIQKTTDRPFVERGEKFSYKLHFINGSEGLTNSTHLYDILPFNGDERGSNFHGSYQIESITLDFTEATETAKASGNLYSIYISSSKNAKNEDTAISILQNGVSSDDVSWQKLDDKTINNNVIVWDNLNIEDITAMYFFFETIYPHEQVSVTLEFLPVDLEDNKQLTGDVYSNNFLEYSREFGSIVKSNTVDIHVVKRTLSGLAWADSNKDGIRTEDEEPVSGITASLYRTSLSTFDSDGSESVNIDDITLYPAYDVMGDKVKSITTDSNGSYSFTDLESGTYYVVFSNTGRFNLTSKDSGEDDTKDSDADSTENNVFYISNINLPIIEEMQSYNYKSDYHDIGLDLSFVTLPDTGGHGTDVLKHLSLIFFISSLALIYAFRKYRK